MVVAVRAELVGLVGLARVVLAEALFALFAGEGELRFLEQGVVLRLAVALGAVEPFAACGVRRDESGRGRTAGGADGDLGVEDVFAGESALALTHVGKTYHMVIDMLLILSSDSSAVLQVEISRRGSVIMHGYYDDSREAWTPHCIGPSS